MTGTEKTIEEMGLLLMEKETEIEKLKRRIEMIESYIEVYENYIVGGTV